MELILIIWVVATLVACGFSYFKTLIYAKKLSTWKEEYEKKGKKDLENLDTISDIEKFYGKENEKELLSSKFLFKRKAYLLSNLSDSGRIKEFVKTLIPLIVTGALPEIITLVLMGVDTNNVKETQSAVLILLCVYLFFVLWLAFHFLCVLLRSSKSAYDLKREYELKCLNRLIDNHFKNN